MIYRSVTRSGLGLVLFLSTVLPKVIRVRVAQLIETGALAF